MRLLHFPFFIFHFSLLICAQGAQISSPSASLSRTPAGVAASLTVTASDPSSKNIEITFHGRPQSAGPDFSFVLIPDTQNYTKEIKEGTFQMFEDQIKWILLNAKKQNIAAVLHLGDITDDGDRHGDFEWLRAGPAAMHLLENPKLSGIHPDGVPYIVCIGNHDMRVTEGVRERLVGFNKFFGIEHFKNKSYYGGSFRKSTHSNHYILFDGGTEKFIAISLAYHDPINHPAVLEWAKDLLNKHPDRRGIIVTHFVMRTSVQGPFSEDGEAIYNALKDCPNLFIMVGGHTGGEGRRKDVHNGRVVYSFVKDFQFDEGGGEGFLSILTLSPRNNKIHGQTYSPYLNKWKSGSDSKFTLDYDFGKAGEFAPLGTFTATSGAPVTCTWSNLTPGSSYEWYAESRTTKKTTRLPPSYSESPPPASP